MSHNWSRPAGEWVIVVNAPGKWLTANQVLGQLHPMARARAVRQWRTAAYNAAVDAGLPVGLRRVRIEVEARFRGKAPVHDRDNLAPTIKACVDGLGRPQGKAKGYGLVPDDSDRHIESTHLTIGPPLHAAQGESRGRLIITIKEIPE